MEEKIDRLENALHQIRSWVDAYPLRLFPEPDWSEVRQKLGDGLLTRVSAANMRHVISQVGRIVDAAMQPTEKNAEGERQPKPG
jgi:hypothetical protein